MSEAGLPPGQPAPPATLAPVEQSHFLELRKESGTGSEGIASVWYVEEGGDEAQCFRTNFNSEDHENGGKALVLAQANLARDGNADNMRAATVPMTSAASFSQICALEHNRTRTHKLCVLQLEYDRTRTRNLCVPEYVRTRTCNLCVPEHVRTRTRNLCVPEYVRTRTCNLCVPEYVRTRTRNLCVPEYVRTRTHNLCVPNSLTPGVRMVHHTHIKCRVRCSMFDWPTVGDLFTATSHS